MSNEPKDTPDTTSDTQELRDALVEYRFQCNFAYQDIIERQGEDFNGKEYHEALERVTQKILDTIQSHTNKARIEEVNTLPIGVKTEYDTLMSSDIFNDEFKKGYASALRDLELDSKDRIAQLQSNKESNNG